MQTTDSGSGLETVDSMLDKILLLLQGKPSSFFFAYLSGPHFVLQLYDGITVVVHYCLCYLTERVHRPNSPFFAVYLYIVAC